MVLRWLRKKIYSASMDENFNSDFIGEVKSLQYRHRWYEEWQDVPTENEYIYVDKKKEIHNADI